VARLAGTLRPSRFPQEAARRLFEVEARSGSYLFDVRNGRITPLGTGERLAAELPQAEAELTHASLLWTVPEPATKGVAAVLTVSLIIYVGVDTFWGLIQGFRHLMAEADRAVTFDELRDAGERFGKVMGRNAARAFVMLATAAIGSTGATLGAKLPALPGTA